MKPQFSKDDSLHNNTISVPHHQHQHHHQNHKKSTLTLDFNQTKRNHPSLKELKFQSKHETETQNNSKDGKDGKINHSNALLNTLLMEDNQPIVLTSPDLDLVKLSTPDLDNYLYQLQEELSFSIPNLHFGEGVDVSASSIPCCNSANNTSQVECINFSLIDTTCLQTEIDTPSFREIMDLAESVTTEARYNSFDSGFSDLSVKTEIESELEEEILENDKIGWHIFENAKPKNLFLENAESMSNCCHGYQQTDSRSIIKIEKQEFQNSYFQNQPACEFNKLPPTTNFNNDYNNNIVDTSNYISDNNGYNNKNNINNNNNKVPLYSQPPTADNIIVNHHHHHHQGHYQHTQQANNKQEKQNKSRQEAHFKPPHNFSLNNTKQNFKDEPNRRLREFSCNSLDSNSGGPCSDYSCFDDGSNVSNVPHRTVSQTGLSGNISTHFGLDFPSKQSNLVDQISNGRLLSPDLTTVEAKRKSFRRQNAESRYDFDACHNQFLDSRAFKYQQDYAVMSNIKVEGSYEESPSLNIGNSFDMIDQDFLKLQRKRARNRLAATRCRNRKLERINYLRAEVEYLKGVNVQYSDKVCRLRHEVNQLKCQVMNHVTKGCDLSCLWLSLR